MSLLYWSDFWGSLQNLVKYVAGQRVSESEEKILIKFGYESGIMMVREFKRVIENN